MQSGQCMTRHLLPGLDETHDFMDGRSLSLCELFNIFDNVPYFSLGQVIYLLNNVPLIGSNTPQQQNPSNRAHKPQPLFSNNLFPAHPFLKPMQSGQCMTRHYLLGLDETHDFLDGPYLFPRVGYSS